MFFIIHAVVFISLMCTIQCDANFNEIYLSIINTILYRNYSIQDPNIKFENEICHKFVSDFTISNWVKILLLRDASARPLPSGLAQGNLYDLGDFDACRNIHDNYNTVEYFGKYCMGTFQLNNLSTVFGSSIPDIIYSLKLNLGLCLPDFCSAKDFSSTYPKLNFSETQCFSKSTDPELDLKSIFGITLLCFFFFIVLLSTIYEAIINYKNKKTYHHPLWTAFSAIRNTKKIQNTQGQMLCLNGIRAFSIIWIICYHELILLRYGSVTNVLYIYQFMAKQEQLFLLQAVVAVDSFLAIAGLVLVFSYMRSCDKGTKYNVLKSYVHRYFRITPILAVAILIHATLLNHFGNGPVWNKFQNDLVTNCEQYWWSALLYIQNYVNTRNNCVPQSWYLSVDMQLFILSPIILVPLRNWPKYTLGSMGALVIAGIIVPFTITYVNDLPASGYLMHERADLFMSEIYFKTHSRFGPYVIGMITGYLIYFIQKGKKEYKLNLGFVLLLWFIILTSFLVIIFGGKNTIDNNEDIWGHSFFNGFFRSAWAVTLCIMIMLCVTGYGGPINSILSWPIVQIVGKLSFCMYIVHYAVIILRIASLRTSTNFSQANLIFTFWGDLMVTIILSYLAHITFELPFLVVEKYFTYYLTKLCRYFHKD